MKNIFIKTFAFTLALASATSCNGWLEVSPKTNMKAEDLFKNEAGFRDALIGVYSLMCMGNSYGCDLTYAYIDVLAQYYESPHKNSSSGYIHSMREASEYDYAAMSEESRIRSIWSNHYSAIANLNLGLQFIDGKRDVFPSQSSFDAYKGEFLALRAMLHFDILRLFASSGAMDNGHGFDNPGIPYLEEYTNIAQPQLTGHEVLTNIKRDLYLAKDLFANIDTAADALPPLNQRYRFNHNAVIALLARVHLYAGEKTEALDRCKEIIGEADGEMPSYYSLATEPATSGDMMFNGEIIFALDVQKLKDLSSTFIYSSDTSLGTLSQALTMSDDGYKTVFGERSTMEYRQAWMKPYAPDGGVSSVLDKFNGKNFIPMLKVSELFLIAAECAGEQEGRRYIDKIRNHRGLSNSLPSTTVEDNILWEYRREFIGEGQLFFFYKRRAMILIGAEEDTAVPDLNGVYNLPIPQSEVEFGNIKK